MRFSRSIGQRAAAREIHHAHATDTFPRALIISGPPGRGHAAVALDVADQLLCASTGQKPCGHCAACRDRIRETIIHPSCLLSMPEGAQKTEDGRKEAAAERIQRMRENPYAYFRIPRENIAIQQVRDCKMRLSFTQQRGRVRVVLVLWADDLKAPAANAMLKMLEEPPADTYFLLCCESPATLLPTLRSRCANLPLAPLGTEAMASFARARAKGGGRALPVEWMPLVEGSPGLLEAWTLDDEENVAIACGLLEICASRDWWKLSDFLHQEDCFNQGGRAIAVFEAALRLLHWNWTTGGLRQEAEGRNPLLVRVAAVPGLREYTEDFAALLEKSIAAVRQFARPSVAVLGGYLEMLLQSPRPVSLQEA